MDLNIFAKKVNLTPNQTMQQIQELAKEGFLQRIGNGFAITEKGKLALKSLVSVPEDMGFHFYLGINQPANLTAKTLQEFYKAIKQVSAGSLEFHVFRSDFENWLTAACREPELANMVKGLKAAGLKGEELREALLKTLDAKYGIQDLL